MLFIRGNNLYPASIENVVREAEEIVEFRMVVTRRGDLSELTIQIELRPDRAAEAESCAGSLEQRISEQLHFRTAVEVVPPETLPRFEMKARRVVIEDERV